jgi:flagellum-specific ATP synthase
MPIMEPLPTGIRVIDGLLTLGLGQRLGLFAGSGIGKSTLLGEIAKGCQSDRNVIVLVGERGREVNPFLHECLGPQGLAKSVVIVSTSEQTPLMRVRSVQTAITMADSFRAKGHRVLFLLDSMTRLAMAQREIGLMIGEPPTSRGYTPSVFQLLADVLEQLGNSDAGSISAIVTILTEGDDLNDPIADSVRSLVDGHVVLDRRIAERGRYPAVNVNRSLSRVFPQIVDGQQQLAAQKVRSILATYEESEDLIRAGAYTPGNDTQLDKAIALRPKIETFLHQPIGTFCDIDDTRAGLAEVSQGW